MLLWYYYPEISIQLISKRDFQWLGPYKYIYNVSSLLFDFSVLYVGILDRATTEMTGYVMS